MCVYVRDKAGFRLCVDFSALSDLAIGNCSNCLDQWFSTFSNHFSFDFGSFDSLSFLASKQWETYLLYVINWITVKINIFYLIMEEQTRGRTKLLLTVHDWAVLWYETKWYMYLLRRWKWKELTRAPMV